MNGDGENSTEDFDVTQTPDDILSEYLSQEVDRESGVEPQEEPFEEEVIEQDQEAETDENKNSISREEYEALQRDLDKQRKRVKDQAAFIGRQASEIGALRQEKARAIAERRVLIERGDLTTREEAEQIYQLKRDEEQFEELSEQQVTLERQQQHMDAINTHIGGNVPVDDIIELLREDGIPDESIQMFRSNPYDFPPFGIIQAAKRVKDRRDKDMAIGIARKAIKALEAAEQASPQNSRSIVKNINKAINQKPNLSAASGGGVSSKNSVGDVTRLSDAELESLLGGK